MDKQDSQCLEKVCLLPNTVYFCFPYLSYLRPLLLFRAVKKMRGILRVPCLPTAIPERRESRVVRTIMVEKEILPITSQLKHLDVLGTL